MDRDQEREFWKAISDLRRRMSAMESRERTRVAVASDRKHLLDSWIVRGVAVGMLLLQTAALYFAVRGGHR